MRTLKGAFFVLLVSPAVLLAQDRTVDAPIHSGPTVNTGGNSNLTPNLGVGGSNVNTVNTQAGVSDFGGAGAAATSADAQPQGARADMANPNGAAALGNQEGAQIGAPGVAPTGMTMSQTGETNPQAGLGARNAPGVPKNLAGNRQLNSSRQALTKAVGGMTGNAASSKGLAATGDSAAELSHFFDASHKYDAKVAGPENGADAAVSGPAQSVEKKIVENVRLASKEAPANVPGLFLGGLAAADQAAQAGAFTKEKASMAAQKILAAAAEKAKTSLAELANGAYAAAARGASGETEVERAVGSKPDGSSDIGMRPRKPGAFDQWEELLGGPGKPLISNLELLKKDVWRAQEEAAKAGASAAVAERIQFPEKEDGSFFAELPNSSVTPVPESAAQLALGQPLGMAELSEHSDLAVYENDPSHKNAFRAARARAGVAAALGIWFKAAVMDLWQWVWDHYLILTGRGPVQVLAKLTRPPSAQEAGLAGKSAVTFADFGSINGPFLAAQTLLSKPGALTVAQAHGALTQAQLLAQAAYAATANRAGLEAVKRLRARVSRETAGLGDGEEVPASALELLLPGEGGDLSHWLERMRSAALERLDEGALRNLSKQTRPALMYADLAGGNPMVRIYLKGSDGGKAAAGLSALGFRIETAGGSAVAVYDWESGSDGTAALNGAIELLASGKSAPDTANAADTVEIDKAVAAYLGHNAKDRLADFRAVDPGLSQFVPADIVEKGSRGFWVERSRHRLDGRVQDLVLLRDLATRRPVFGQAFPLPAH